VPDKSKVRSSIPRFTAAQMNRLISYGSHPGTMPHLRRNDRMGKEVSRMSITEYTKCRKAEKSGKPWSSKSRV